MNGVSIIICCYNGAARIGETLTCLARQRLPASFPCEVILVDNNSNDETVEVASHVWEKAANQEIRFRIVKEEKQGLSFARRTGLHAATFPIVIFCDDDNHLEDTYVQNAATLFTQKPDIGIAGASISPKFKVQPGSWVKDFYSSLAIGQMSPSDSYVDWVYGAGMVVSKQLYQAIENSGISLFLTDRLGNKHTSGGDAELCLLARYLGFGVYFSTKLRLHHAIESRRLSKRKFVKDNFLIVFPVIYLYLLGRIIADKTVLATELYRDMLKRSAGQSFYFFPRIVVGRHRFYSFILFFQNIQILGWLFFRKARFEKITTQIKENLR
jgi:glycosyltransferase involved in cell wall biosynthesis